MSVWDFLGWVGAVVMAVLLCSIAAVFVAAAVGAIREQLSKTDEDVEVFRGERDGR